jgi:hypothetical protein
MTAVIRNAPAARVHPKKSPLFLTEKLPENPIFAPTSKILALCFMRGWRNW